MATRSRGPTLHPATPAGEQLSIVDGLARLSFLVHAAFERRAAERDLSIVQMRLLGVLRDRMPSMNELAALLGLDKSSVTGLVDRAERRGLVARVRSTTDRRAVLVRVSDEGRSLISRAAADFQTDVAAMLDTLRPADRAALSDLVGQILLAHATAHGIDLSPGAQKQTQPAVPAANPTPSHNPI